MNVLHMDLVHLIAWSAVLLIVQVALQAVPAVLECGLPYAFSPRDEGRQPKGTIANRLARALANLLETYPAFVALALALLVSGRTGGNGLLGAQIWLAARVVYLPVYALGIPLVRTLAWAASLAGLALMILTLLG